MDEILQLNKKNLGSWSKRIFIPTYNSTNHKASIVHIGVGGFHRAHQAFYIHLLQGKSKAAEWSICGIGLRDGDRKMGDILSKQDYLYTLIIKHPDGKVEPHIVGSIIDFKLSSDGPEQVVKKMASPDTKIVSLTITEGGYNFNPSTGEFDFENIDIQHDLKHPDNPKSIYGFLTASLRKRRELELPAFTVMSCDNIEHNGDITKKMLIAFAKKQDEELAKWIENKVCFPNSMVDRITPVTTSKDIEYLKEQYGLLDEWPVTCEPFIQWVIEDKFSNGRPELDKVGVQFVEDVKPYEKMKLRLLNAGHSVLGILGAIHGYKTINACMEDDVFVSYLRAFMDIEATPVIDPLAGIDLNDYKDSLLTRFANPNIMDAVSRICSESSAKLPKFLIPTITENLVNNGHIKYASLVIAAWCYYSDKSVDRNGQSLEIIDALSIELHEAAKKTSEDPLAFLKQESIFGDLCDNKRFVQQYREMIQSIYKDANIRKLMEDMI